MKKIFLLILVMPLLGHGQDAFTVSNIPGVTANFFTLQGAVDSAPAGSVLYVFPSPIDYGNVILHKKLSIYGTGFMLDQNIFPYTAPNKYGVTLTSVFFGPGSDNSYIEGLQVIGLTANALGLYRFYLDSVNNVTISRCYADIWPNYPVGNITIQTVNTFDCSFNQCYLYLNNLEAPNHSGGSFYSEWGIGSQNLQFKNNIIDSRGYPTSFYVSGANSQPGGSSTVFTNNTIICGIPSSNFGNSTLINNFIINTDLTGTISFANNVHGVNINNITNASNLFAPNSGNYQQAKIDSIFAYSGFGYHSFDQSWQVKDTSFAKTFATDGKEAGAYGGNDPYVLSGIPNLPNIYDINITADANKRGNILVHIKGKATY